MTHVSKDPPDLSRRTALTGLAGGAGVLLASGCTPLGATSAQGPTPSCTGSATGSADGATPGVMTLFKDPGFNFNGLLALGAAGQGSSEVGEVLTAVNEINKAGTETTRLRALRASQYYGQALFFVLGSDDPGGEERLYKSGRRGWDTFCRLSDPPPVTADVPYGGRRFLSGSSGRTAPASDAPP
ncbi:hypothetical protein ACFUNF_31915 [Streptomyces sp. NPDC057291]|uniref:hypothetical protein n=1 Tax=Streptomyces sp. NPDC057291 TaxID=3346087 RepID=UPI00362BE774